MATAGELRLEQAHSEVEQHALQTVAELARALDVLSAELRVSARMSESAAREVARTLDGLRWLVLAQDELLPRMIAARAEARWGA